MGRAPCCDERVALKKGPWTPDEDQKLVAYIQQHGHGSWRNLPERAGLARCGKSCRLRWTNYLRPDIKRGQFSHEEDQMIVQLHSILGNRWSAIASHLPRRTDNEIKNYWNTHLKKRLAQMGIDPVTHKTSAAGLALSSPWTPLVSTQLTHNSQWSSALAEAEARLSGSRPPPSPPSLLAELIHASQPPHPSAYFMRSWKTKVEDTLRPTFGAVKLEPPNRHFSPSPHIPKTLQDWNTALGNQITASPSPSPSPSPSSAMVPYLPPKPELLVDMFTEMTTPMTPPVTTSVAPSLDRPGHHHVWRFASEGGVGLENHFSPTSILSGPDSESMCCSGDSDSRFEFLSHENDGTGMSAYHNFPLIEDGECGHGSESVSMTDIPESFWQSGQQGESLLEDLKNITSEQCGQGLDLIIPQLEFNISSSEFDPQF